jgi:hypothetical protein
LLLLLLSVSQVEQGEFEGLSEWKDEDTDAGEATIASQ